MRLLIDLGHPAHVHYFKHFILEMKKNGHQIKLVARDKEVLYQLLEDYEFEYIKRGAGGKSILSKLGYLLKADFILIKAALKFKPDLFISFASPYAAHAAWFINKPHIVFDDTEHAKFEQLLYAPFSDTILNPKSFWKKFSKRQLFFDGFMELSHLIPRLFKPDPNIIKQYGVDPYSKYFILRFVSWDASHDLGYNGLSIKIKREIVDLLSKYGRVLISSEPGLPADLEQYRLKIRPADLHHFLAFAQMYIGEGATTAAESIFLGTSAVTFINTLDAGTIKEQHDKYGLISVKDASKFVENVQNQLVTNYKEIAKINRLKVLTDKIDVTAFMCWFVENFPESRELLKKDSEIQYQFKIAEEDGD